MPFTLSSRNTGTAFICGLCGCCIPYFGLWGWWFQNDLPITPHQRKDSAQETESFQDEPRVMSVNQDYRRESKARSPDGGLGNWQIHAHHTGTLQYEWHMYFKNTKTNTIASRFVVHANRPKLLRRTPNGAQPFHSLHKACRTLCPPGPLFHMLCDATKASTRKQLCSIKQNSMCAALLSHLRLCLAPTSHAWQHEQSRKSHNLRNQ